MDQAERDRLVVALLIPYVSPPEPIEDELDREILSFDEEPDPLITEQRVERVLAQPYVEDMDAVLATERRAS